MAQKFIASSPITAPGVVGETSAAYSCLSVSSAFRFSLEASAPAGNSVAVFLTSDAAIGAGTFNAALFNRTDPATWPAGCQWLTTLSAGNSGASAYEVGDATVPYIVLGRLQGADDISVLVSGIDPNDVASINTAGVATVTGGSGVVITAVTGNVAVAAAAGSVTQNASDNIALTALSQVNVNGSNGVSISSGAAPFPFPGQLQIIASSGQLLLSSLAGGATLKSVGGITQVASDTGVDVIGTLGSLTAYFTVTLNGSELFKCLPNKIAFFGGTPAVQVGAYTINYAAAGSKTLANYTAGALGNPYTGIASGVGGTPYATVADLNTSAAAVAALQTQVLSLSAVMKQLLADIKSYSLTA